MHSILVPLGFLSLIAAAGYIFLAVFAAVAAHMRRQPRSVVLRPPVTILKPLCGAEPGLHDNLRSFCLQDYPQYEIIFGVRDAADSACAVVGRLMAEFPALPIRLVVDPQLHGSNRKVSNLINMLPYAKHELLVMADSDSFVRDDYLAAVAGPLNDGGVGLVTCLYRAIPTGGIWSRLGAMYVNEWYMPLVMLSWLFGYRGYVSGQTLCMRHSTLRAIGGLEALTNQLAEDHRLGQLVRGLNLRVELSPYVIDGEHHEPDLRSVAQHELRWMRTIRAVRPRSFLGIFLTFSLPLALLGIVLAADATPTSPVAWGLFAGGVAARIALHFVHRIKGRRTVLSELWLLPLCDMLILWVWLRSLFTSRIAWRNNEFNVDADGVIHPLR
ncbi:MAG: bacteriohopanetetrol glucosamine biosynthesis glycosyltransferase HpnI [Steroidobacteraceae bacterium]|jgi:ceramide glucosyltransferase